MENTLGQHWTHLLHNLIDEHKRQIRCQYGGNVIHQCPKVCNKMKIDLEDIFDDDQYNICYYWEHIYGNLQPTMSPTPSLTNPPTFGPTTTKLPTLVPTNSQSQFQHSPWICCCRKRLLDET
mmetsp:Transcript_30713/g.47052  ORF Transcript_30713/g.47052 Transcript_30713/m.47052 type:complete len:122 (-) Transcript_30713:269-634(-)